MDFDEDMTLGEARDLLRSLVGEGHRCPLCSQWAQIYRWSLYSTAARALILFYKLGAHQQFVHSNSLKDLGHKGQGDASRLGHWKLMVEERVRRDDGGRSGFWAMTNLGLRFVLGQATIPKYVFVYDGRVLKTSGPSITIQDALGTKFDYGQMMSG